MAGARRRFAPPAPAPPAADEGDWLSLGDDDFAPGGLSPLRERDDGPARSAHPGRGPQLRQGGPPPGLAAPEPDPRPRRGARSASSARTEEASRLRVGARASAAEERRRPSRLGHQVRLPGRDPEPRRVGDERIAEGRDRVQALRERVPPRIPRPAPRIGGGDGKPPPPRLPRRISSRRPRKPKPGRVKKLRLLIVLLGLGLLAIVSTFFGMMMAIAQDLPQLENKQEFAERARTRSSSTTRATRSATLLNNNQRDPGPPPTRSRPYMKQAAVAIEDKRFYEHRGVDIQGMARAAIEDVLPGGSTQGASTITAAVRQERARGPGQPDRLREVPRGRARLPARAPLDQGQDPHRVPQHDLLRRGRLRDRGGGPAPTSAGITRAAAAAARSRARRCSTRGRRRCSPASSPPRPPSRPADQPAGRDGSPQPGAQEHAGPGRHHPRTEYQRGLAEPGPGRLRDPAADGRLLVPLLHLLAASAGRGPVRRRPRFRRRSTRSTATLDLDMQNTAQSDRREHPRLESRRPPRWS